MVETIKSNAPTSNILEIGPGLGALTFPLIQEGFNVTAIEIDKKCAQFLTQHTQHTHAQIIHEDALNGNWNAWVPDATPCTLVSNLPYQITSSILFRFQQWRETFPLGLFTIQKDVFKRLIGKPGTSDYSRLTVMLGLTHEHEALFPIPKHAFFPIPNVESIFFKSTVLHPTHQLHVHASMEPSVFAVLEVLVEKAFRYRRKTLLSALKQESLTEPWISIVKDWLKDQGLPLDIRGERLTIPQFSALAMYILCNPF